MERHGNFCLYKHTLRLARYESIERTRKLLWRFKSLISFYQILLKTKIISYRKLKVGIKFDLLNSLLFTVYMNDGTND